MKSWGLNPEFKLEYMFLIFKVSIINLRKIMDSIHLSPQYAKGILLYPSSNNLFFHAVKFLSIFSVDIFFQERPLH